MIDAVVAARPFFFERQMHDRNGRERIGNVVVFPVPVLRQLINLTAREPVGEEGAPE